MFLPLAPFPRYREIAIQIANFSYPRVFVTPVWGDLTGISSRPLTTENKSS